VKVCRKCGVERPQEEFAVDRSKATGHRSHCKSCDRAKSRRYYEENRERKLAYMAERNTALRAARHHRGRRQRRAAA
jgi:hypothetical protein